MIQFIEENNDLGNNNTTPILFLEILGSSFTEMPQSVPTNVDENLTLDEEEVDEWADDVVTDFKKKNQKEK